MRWFIETDRLDQLKGVLGAAVRWLERLVIVDGASGKSLSIQIDVSNDGEYAFLIKYMTKFNKVPARKYVVVRGC